MVTVLKIRKKKVAQECVLLYVCVEKLKNSATDTNGYL
jgi:hypothetical protein